MQQNDLTPSKQIITDAPKINNTQTKLRMNHKKQLFGQLIAVLLSMFLVHLYKIHSESYTSRELLHDETATLPKHPIQPKQNKPYRPALASLIVNTGNNVQKICCSKHKVDECSECVQSHLKRISQRQRMNEFVYAPQDFFWEFAYQSLYPQVDRILDP